MPWRCLEVRFWVSIPNYQAKLGNIYTEALAMSAAECSSDELHSRHLQVGSRSLASSHNTNHSLFFARSCRCRCFWGDAGSYRGTVYTHTCKHTLAHSLTHMCVCVCVYTYVCVCIYTYFCMKYTHPRHLYVKYAHTHTHSHTHTHTLGVGVFGASRIVQRQRGVTQRSAGDGGGRRPTSRPAARARRRAVVNTSKNKKQK